MHSNVHSPKSNAPPSADLFSQERWRNIQQIIRETFLRFNDVLQSMDSRIDIIQRTQRADRDELIDKMLTLTTEQRTLSEKIDKLDSIIEDKLTKAMRTVDANQYIENRYGVGEPTFKSSHDHLVRQLNAYGSNKVLRPLPVQQLYIESNQTMFGMVTEQISKLKQQQQIIVENVARKNKATISISNEMCSKLEGIERQIALLKKKQEYMARLGGTSDEKGKGKTKPNDFYENLKITNLSEIIAELQQQLHQKAYLKDITQIIRSSMLPLEETVETMRMHFESNMSSTNKILNHQSIINEELCREMKVGKWEWIGVSASKMGILVWEKELINLYPESLMWSKNTSSLVVRQPGIYRFQIVVFTPEGVNPEVSLIVNRRQCKYRKDQQQRFGHLYTDVVKIQKNSNISISCDTKLGAAVLTIRRI